MGLCYQTCHDELSVPINSVASRGQPVNTPSDIAPVRNALVRQHMGVDTNQSTNVAFTSPTKGVRRLMCEVVDANAPAEPPPTQTGGVKPSRRAAVPPPLVDPGEPSEDGEASQGLSDDHEVF